MRLLRGLFSAACLSGLLTLSGCGDQPTSFGAPPPPATGGNLSFHSAPATDGSPVPSVAPTDPPATVTGVPVQAADGNQLTAAEQPATLPAPSFPVDGFEAQDGWFLAPFGNPGALQKCKPAYPAPVAKDQWALQVAYAAGDKGKACLKLDRRLSLKPDGKITLSVYNHAQADIAVAAAFSTGAEHIWHESRPQTAAPGWNTLSWNFADATWKAEASQWQHTVAVGDPADVRAIHLLVFNERRTGTLTVGGLLIEAVRPAPPAPAPTAAIDWNTYVAQLPVNPLGKKAGLQAGAWINDMTGDPARVLVAPDALTETTDRMLVLDWAAAAAPEQRKAGFVAAKQMFAPTLLLDKTGALALDVYNAGDGEAAMSVGIISAATATYHESEPIKLAANAWTTVQLPLGVRQYKSAASNWKPTGAIADADQLAGVVIKAFTTQAAGRLVVTALTAPIVTPPPTPQPMPPVVEAQPQPAPDAPDAPAPVAPDAPAPVTPDAPEMPADAPEPDAPPPAAVPADPAVPAAAPAADPAATPDPLAGPQ